MMDAVELGLLLASKIRSKVAEGGNDYVSIGMLMVVKDKVTKAYLKAKPSEMDGLTEIEIDKEQAVMLKVLTRVKRNKLMLEFKKKGFEACEQDVHMMLCYNRLESAIAEAREKFVGAPTETMMNA